MEYLKGKSALMIFGRHANESQMRLFPGEAGCCGVVRNWMKKQ